MKVAGRKNQMACFIMICPSHRMKNHAIEQEFVTIDFLVCVFLQIRNNLNEDGCMSLKVFHVF